ncbi:hypothetical protein KAR91_79960 [Candidatus Pacearchaeota archaeon]|nr:hypothetical protein [Candidatus Pacearchaeota archaeon]
MPKAQSRSLQVDTANIRDNIIQGGIARRVAAHPVSLKGSSETFKWLVRNDKTFLRYASNFDRTRYRSKFGTQGIVLPTPGIEDGLMYTHYELEGVQGDILPLDDRQRLLASYFAEAEDRIFFAGPDPGIGSAGNMSITNLASAATINGAVPGTYGSTTATAELDLNTVVTTAATLGGMIGQIRTAFGPNLKANALKLVVTGDVIDSIDGAVDSATTRTYHDVIVDALNRAGADGGGEILATNMLGAALDFDTSEIEVTAGTTNAMLMWIGSGFAEVQTSALAQRRDENDIDGLRIAIEEKYVPVFKNPLAHVYSATVANL